MRASLFVIWLALVFVAPEGAQAQAPPRWFADLTVGRNYVNGMGDYGHSGWDAAVGIGIRMKRSATMSLLATTTAHVAKATDDFTVTCSDVLGVACYVTPAVLPLADVLVGAEYGRKYAVVRVLAGASVHRTDAQAADYLWGPQIRADVTVPATRRIAGVASFRYTRVIEGIGNRMYVQGFSAGVQVQ